MENNDDLERAASTAGQPDEKSDLGNRRELVRKLGRFAAYAAPLTMLITAEKAKAISQAP